MDKKYQIFISSTYEDLKEKRRKVQETILSMYQFPIGMEMFSADDADQWEIIQETIDNSDYYVLIIGRRYGSIIQNGSDAGISYTQKEYRYAKSIGVPVLAFLSDREASFKDGEIETDPEKLSKLNEFIDEVKSGNMVNFWKNEDDLAAKVAVALQKQISRGKRPGWIRATFSMDDVLKNANEVIRLQQENAELREELSELKEHSDRRMPFLSAEINDSDFLTLQFTCFDDFSSWSHNDLSKRLQSYLKANAYPLKITFSNSGTAKAKDVYAEFEFPEELLLYYELPVRSLLDADPPYEIKRPQQMTLYNLIHAYQNLRMIPDESMLRSPETPYYLANNQIHLHLSDLMNYYDYCIDNNYYLIATQKGTFEIKCFYMCEDFKEPQTQTITITVE